MGVFCDMLKFGSTAAVDCRTGQNKDRYCKKELLIYPPSLFKPFVVNIRQSSK